ncbi:MAG: hypothetical protein ACE5FV_07380 [Woeseia sp.]
MVWLTPPSIDEEPLGDEPVVRWIGAGASSSSENGFIPQPATDTASAMAVSRRLLFRQHMLNDMIDGCSIKMV